MKIAIIISNKDPASKNIKQKLLESNLFIVSDENYEDNQVYIFKKDNNVKIYTTEKIPVHAENIDKEIEADLFIFATKHSGKSGIPSLSVHSPGNWSIAELGGKNNKLCVAPALYLRKAMLLLDKYNKIDFEVVQECTHHGPYVEKPIMFIEIGSTEVEWANMEAADVIAKVILDLIQGEPEKKPVIFGIGGLHTTPNFRKLLKDYAIGHVCPKYMLKYLTNDLIKQAMEKTVPKTDKIFVDWKGLKEFKEKVKSMLEIENIDFERTDKY